MALNSVIIQGRVTKDIELRYTQSGKAVVGFTVACDRGKDSGADFINCVAWEKCAEFISKYFTKGRMMLIDGRLAQRTYEDRDGNKRTTYEVIVNTVNFCDDKSKTESKPVAPEFVELPEDDGELPF